jgi:acid phosphatase type 7
MKYKNSLKRDTWHACHMKISRISIMITFMLLSSITLAEIHGPFIQIGGDAAKESIVCWLSTKNQNFSLKVNGKWKTQISKQQPFGTSKYTANRIVLTGLTSGSSYEFRISNTNYTSKTMPEKTKKLTFAVGGDMMSTPERLAQTTRQLAKRNPDFSVFGGDLAYANGTSVERWPVFLDVMAKEALDDKGRLIPAIVCIGNHEVKGGYHKTPKEAPFFYSLFELPEGKSNYVQTVAGFAAFVMLDSNHTQKIKDQSPWLENTLKMHKHFPHLFPVYHFPAYGLVKGGLKNQNSKDAREHWVPLFEKYNVRLAFENDHHIYKRSKPIRKSKVNEASGVTYVGDGAYGVTTRKLPKNWQDLWYVESAKSVRHLILVTTSEKGAQVEAIDENGNTIDKSFIKRLAQ